MGQGRAQIYNLISTLFLVLSVVAIVLVVVRMAGPTSAPQRPQVAVPTAAILPSATLTLTWTPSPTATFTLTPSQTITPSVSPSITWTQIPTLTPSLTFTIPPTATIGPSATLTAIPPSLTVEPSQTITTTLDVTNTLIPTETPTVNDFTPVATQPPPSPFPFVLKDNQVIYTMNFANTAQCAWQGIGGQVFDLNGAPLIQARVHVFGQGVDLYTASGSNTLYGLSGWEVPLSTTVTSNSYIVELQSSQGTIISPQVTVTFAPDCTKNLALVSFQQTRPF